MLWLHVWIGHAFGPFCSIYIQFVNNMSDRDCWLMRVQSESRIIRMCDGIECQSVVYENNAINIRHGNTYVNMKINPYVINWWKRKNKILFPIPSFLDKELCYTQINWKEFASFSDVRHRKNCDLKLNHSKFRMWTWDMCMQTQGYYAHLVYDERQCTYTYIVWLWYQFNSVNTNVFVWFEIESHSGILYYNHFTTNIN